MYEINACTRCTIVKIIMIPEKITLIMSLVATFWSKTHMLHRLCFNAMLPLVSNIIMSKY